MNPILVAFITVIVMDAVWLSLNYSYHSKLITAVQHSPIAVRLIPAIAVYILIPLAVTYFAVNEAKSVKNAGMKGALLGLSMYGLYDLTNLATLKGWTYEMALMDIAWGTLVCTTSAAVAYKFGNKRY